MCEWSADPSSKDETHKLRDKVITYFREKERVVLIDQNINTIFHNIKNDQFFERLVNNVQEFKVERIDSKSELEELVKQIFGVCSSKSTEDSALTIDCILY